MTQICPAAEQTLLARPADRAARLADVVRAGGGIGRGRRARRVGDELAVDVDANAAVGLGRERVVARDRRHHLALEGGRERVVDGEALHRRGLPRPKVVDGVVGLRRRAACSGRRRRAGRPRNTCRAGRCRWTAPSGRARWSARPPCSRRSSTGERTPTPRAASTGACTRRARRSARPSADTARAIPADRA